MSENIGSMQEGLIYLRQDVDEVTHIFGEIQVFPVTEIEASLIFNPLDWDKPRSTDTAPGTSPHS